VAGVNSWWRRARASLRLRLLMGMALAALLACGWLAWWQHTRLHREVWQALEEALVDTAQLLAAQVAEDSTDTLLNCSSLAHVLAAATAAPISARIFTLDKSSVGVRVTITDARGVVAYDSADPTIIGQDHSRWNDVLRTLQGRYGARATEASAGDPTTTVLHVAAPIRRQGRLLGVLTVAKPVAAVAGITAAQRADLIRAALVIAIAVTLMALAAGWWISAPLARLTAHVRRTAAGVRETVPDLGDGSLGLLAQALAELRERLEGRRYAEEYVQALTHELKSPLAGMRACAELLHEDPPIEVRQRFLTTLRGEVERAQALIERLLTLAGLERQLALDQAEPVALADLLTAVAERLVPVAVVTGVRIEVLAEQVAVLGDRLLLGQALGNLLQNAIEFSATDGVVTCQVSRCDGAVRVTVRDHGAGLPAFAAARIFTRFFSLPRPATGRKGTGLGLALVREVARLHGGRASLGNHAEGGTEAVLVLPAV